MRNHRILFITIFILLSSFTYPLHAIENTLLNDRQRLINVYRASNQMNGSLLIAQNGIPLKRKKIGFANIAQRIPFNNNTQFPVASITKQFTAAGIMLLHEANKCDLQQPIIVYLDEHNPLWEGNVPAWANEVTIHQLLTHTSGLGNYTNESWKDISKIKNDDLAKAIIGSIKNKPLQFKPGSQYEYNNTGYFLLGLIIQHLSDEKDLPQFLANHIFKPLNMQDTYLPSLAMEKANIEHINQNNLLPIRYMANILNLQVPPQPLNRLQMQAPYFSAGGLISTADDLLKWQTAFFQGKIVSPNSVKQMTTKYVTGTSRLLGPIHYGYGIQIIDDNPNNIVYRHGGWIDGIRCEMTYSSQSKLSLIYLSNLSPDSAQPVEIQTHQHRPLYFLFNQIAEL